MTPTTGSYAILDDEQDKTQGSSLEGHIRSLKLQSSFDSQSPLSSGLWWDSWDTSKAIKPDKDDSFVSVASDWSLNSSKGGEK